VGEGFDGGGKKGQIFLLGKGKKRREKGEEGRGGKERKELGGVFTSASRGKKGKGGRGFTPSKKKTKKKRTGGTISTTPTRKGANYYTRPKESTGKERTRKEKNRLPRKKEERNVVFGSDVKNIRGEGGKKKGKKNPGWQRKKKRAGSGGCQTTGKPEKRGKRGVVLCSRGKGRLVGRPLVRRKRKKGGGVSRWILWGGGKDATLFLCSNGGPRIGKKKRVVYLVL